MTTGPSKGLLPRPGASDLGPGAAVRGRRPERGSGEGQSGVNLGDGGPDSGTLPLSLPLSLLVIVVSLRREFLSLAVVIWTRHRSSRSARHPALESYLLYAC